MVHIDIQHTDDLYVMSGTHAHNVQRIGVARGIQVLMTQRRNGTGFNTSDNTQDIQGTACPAYQ